MQGTNASDGRRRLHFLMLPCGKPLVFPRRRIAPGEREFALDQPVDNRKFWPRAMVAFRDFHAAKQTVAGIGIAGITIRVVSSAGERDEVVGEAGGVRYLGLRERTSVYHVPVSLMRGGLTGGSAGERARRRRPRGGHAPAYIRAMFVDGVEDATSLNNPRPFLEAFGSRERVERPGTDRERAEWLCGQLRCASGAATCHASGGNLRIWRRSWLRGDSVGRIPTCCPEELLYLQERGGPCPRSHVTLVAAPAVS